MIDLTEETIPWPDALADWLRQVDEQRAEKKAALERGRGPCPGGEDDLCCSECVIPKGEAGAVCEAIRSDDNRCGGTLSYRYDPESTEHDFDGGECWRCSALSSMHDPEGVHLIAIGGDIATAEIPEEFVRLILADWKVASEKLAALQHDLGRLVEEAGEVKLKTPWSRPKNRRFVEAMNETRKLGEFSTQQITRPVEGTPKETRFNMIKRLRAEHGAPLADCRAALQITDGDYDEAVDLIRRQDTGKGFVRSLQTEARFRKLEG